MTTNTNAALAEDLQDTVSKALRRAWQLGQTYWQQADSEYTSQHRKADETQGKFDALVEETRAALSTAAQPLTQDEQENQLCMSSASCGQASTNESAFITSTQRSAGTFSASSERQSYRDSDGMPTERAVLEREWRRMKIALSATAAQPPADGALNTIAAMFHSGEEIEGPDGLAMMVDMSVWNDALDAFEGIIGDEMEPAKEQA